VFVAASVVSITSAAKADDQPFLTIYTTDIDSQGERELEQFFIWKSGHANAAFNEFESRSEFEYGITDNLQASIYLNYDWARERDHAPLGLAESDSNLGVSGELIWRVMNVYYDPIGLALYFEPAVGTHERSFETKILMQKNFFNDTLRTALNVNLEDRWEHDPSGHWNEGSALEFNAGASYNITPVWSVGLEFDNERGFDGEVIGTDERPVSNSFYLGPTIQHVGNPFTVTLGAQTQLPIASDPTHTPGNVVDGMTAGDEHFRTILRVTTDF
jgi:hypothetical protein